MWLELVIIDETSGVVRPKLEFLTDWTISQFTNVFRFYTLTSVCVRALPDGYFW